MQPIHIEQLVSLRDVQEKDITNEWINALNDKNHMRWSRQRQMEHSVESIRKYIEEVKSSNGEFLGIFKMDGKSSLVGTITVRPVLNFRTLGFLVFPGNSGKGFLSMTVPKLLSTLLQKEDIDGIYIGTHKENVPMRKVAEKNKFELVKFDDLPEKLALFTESSDLYIHYLMTR
jgi:RimJ/RimL family protein N-acetyltransferase